MPSKSVAHSGYYTAGIYLNTVVRDHHCVSNARAKGSHYTCSRCGALHWLAVVQHIVHSLAHEMWKI